MGRGRFKKVKKTLLDAVPPTSSVAEARKRKTRDAPPSIAIKAKKNTAPTMIDGEFLTDWGSDKNQSLNAVKARASRQLNSRTTSTFALKHGQASLPTIRQGESLSSFNTRIDIETRLNLADQAEKQRSKARKERKRAREEEQERAVADNAESYPTHKRRRKSKTIDNTSETKPPPSAYETTLRDRLIPERPPEFTASAHKFVPDKTRFKEIFNKYS